MPRMKSKFGQKSIHTQSLEWMERVILRVSKGKLKKMGCVLIVLYVKEGKLHTLTIMRYVNYRDIERYQQICR